MQFIRRCFAVRIEKTVFANHCVILIFDGLFSDSLQLPYDFREERTTKTPTPVLWSEQYATAEIGILCFPY